MTGPDRLAPPPPAAGDADGRAGGCAGEPFAVVAETHSAVVFFAGDRAYKLKKPVNLGFLDFTSPQARAVARQRETELNRRFAPDVYLGVAEIRDPAGRVCDYLVVMRRMPAGRRLSALVKARAPVDGALRQVARALAAWHAAAPRGPQIAEQGSREALRARWQANIGQARDSCGQLLEEAGLGEIERLAGRFTAAARRCSPSGSGPGAWLTATATCSRTTSSAWTTGCGSWTAWSSMTGCAGSTGWTTHPSWRWTWNGSAPPTWPAGSPAGTRSTPATRPRHRCGTTMWRTGRSSAPRWPAYGHAAVTGRPRRRPGSWPG